MAIEQTDRVTDLDASAAARAMLHGVDPTKNTPSDWVHTITLVPRGPEDYIDRFSEAYPRPGIWASSVLNRAGTSDADVCIPVAAGKMLADLENWCIRAAFAMQTRKATRFDSLVSELYSKLDSLKAAQ